LSLFTKGLLDEARACFEAVLRANPDAPEARTMLELISSGGPPKALPASTSGPYEQMREEVSLAAPQLPPPEPRAPMATTAAPETSVAEDTASDPMAGPRERRRLLQRRIVRISLIAAGILATFVVRWPLRVTEECSLVPVSRATVRALADGIIVAVDVDEGSRVNKGQVIARLSDADVKTKLLKATAEVQRLNADMELLKKGSRPEEIARARQMVASRDRELAVAHRALVRSERAYAEKVGSAQDLETARRESVNKQGDLAQAQAQLRLVKAGARPEEVARKEAEIRGYAAEVALYESLLRGTEIHSPIAGIVTTPKIKDKVGSYVTAGGEVAQVVDLMRMRVEIRVPEREIDAVEVGQPVSVKVSSLPTRAFTGEVTWIAQAVQPMPNGNVVRVDSEVENPDALLKPEMTGYAEIECGDRPLAALGLRRLMRWVRVRFLI
jgi:multidrug resistance efflux pump